MKITWEGIDVKSGRKLLDKSGAKCVIVETDGPHDKRWSVYREADAFVWMPRSIERLIGDLNADGYRPAGINDF